MQIWNTWETVPRDGSWVVCHSAIDCGVSDHGDVSIIQKFGDNWRDTYGNELIEGEDLPISSVWIPMPRMHQHETRKTISDDKIFARVTTLCVDGSSQTRNIYDQGDYGFTCDWANTNGSLAKIMRDIKNISEYAKEVRKDEADGLPIKGYLVKDVTLEFVTPAMRYAIYKRQI